MDFLITTLGEPGIGKSAQHLQGYVAETIWHMVLEEFPHPAGATVYLSPVSPDVRHPGGDGYALYSRGPALAFRLWESKKASGPSVDPVVTTRTAAKQLKNEGSRYIAQLVGDRQHDPAPLGPFFARLPDLWRGEDPKTGVGISVATDERGLPDDHFGSVHTDLGGFTQPGQLEGLLVGIGDFRLFSRAVRERVWIGL